LGGVCDVPLALPYSVITPAKTQKFIICSKVQGQDSGKMFSPVWDFAWVTGIIPNKIKPFRIG
jgi:hypothetical protein